jgi:large subunit ribosomal protein L13
MKTVIVKAEEVNRDWHVVDAAGQTVGRIATEIARVLSGKHKPTFSMHVDVGDFVVVVNADKVHLTGNKWGQKLYRRHSGYPGGLRERTAKQMLDKQPEKILELAVRGMLSKNRLRDPRMTRLKVYAQGEHPHSAQQPKALAFGQQS